MSEEIEFDGWIIIPLEKASDDFLTAYNKHAGWFWRDAIYVLQGYKPQVQLEVEQIKYHFPELMNKFAIGIAIGKVGKQITRCGEISFADSPENWKKFYEENA